MFLLFYPRFLIQETSKYRFLMLETPGLLLYLTEFLYNVNLKKDDPRVQKNTRVIKSYRYLPICNIRQFDLLHMRSQLFLRKHRQAFESAKRLLLYCGGTLSGLHPWIRSALK